MHPSEYAASQINDDVDKWRGYRVFDLSVNLRE